MSKVNPQRLIWTGPTKNVDGSAITYEIDYEVGFSDEQGAFQPYMVVVGSLREDGQFVAQISDMALDDGVKVLAMRAIRRDLPALRSAWSRPVEFEIARSEPDAPFNVAVE